MRKRYQSLLVHALIIVFIHVVFLNGDMAKEAERFAMG